MELHWQPNAVSGHFIGWAWNSFTFLVMVEFIVHILSINMFKLQAIVSNILYFNVISRMIPFWCQNVKERASLHHLLEDPVDEKSKRIRKNRINTTVSPKKQPGLSLMSGTRDRLSSISDSSLLSPTTTSLLSPPGLLPVFYCHLCSHWCFLFKWYVALV